MERNAIGIEINSEFCEIIMQRVFDKNPNYKYSFIEQNQKPSLLRDKT
jgi:DNA modification methylase